MKPFSATSLRAESHREEGSKYTAASRGSRARLVPAVCLVLAIILSVCALSAAAAPATGEIDLTGRGNSLSDPVYYDAVDILDSMVGSISDAERNYLEKYCNVKLKINVVDNDVAYNGKCVRLDLAEDGSLTVVALTYSYTARSGDTVTWYPQSVTVGDETVEFTADEDSYRASFSHVSATDLVAHVSYYADVTLSAETLNSILFRASDDIQSIKSEKEAIDAANLTADKQYEAAVKAYEENDALWKTYWLDLTDYDAFLAEKETYETVWLPQYNKDYSDYLAVKAKYDAYLEAVASYDSNVEKYHEYIEYVSYVEYLSLMQRVSDQLANLDAMNIPMSNSKVSDRTVYAAILTGLDFIIQNQDTLKDETDADPEAINLAAEVTPLLKKELDLYFGLTDEALKYEFYIANSETLCSHLGDLTRSLYRLYQNTTIRGAISQQGKKDKFEIMIAQLIMVSNALNGAEITNFEGTATLGYDTIVHVHDKSTVRSLLMNNMSAYVKDVDPTPLVGGYPEHRDEVKKPEHNITEQPQLPVWSGAIPQPPEFIDAPTYGGSMPVEPQVKLDHPGEPPIPQTLEEAKLGLLAAYESGALDSISDRVAYTESGSVRLVCTADRYYDESEVTVSFHVNGKVYPVNVIKGTTVRYNGESPMTFYSDERGNYYFDGWADENGSVCAVPGNFTENIDLYPHYKFEYHTYKITFTVGDSKTTVTVNHGELPVYFGTPTIPDDDSYRYVFTGWDNELTAAVCDATYTAVFDRQPILSVGDTAADITVEDRFIVADCGSTEMKELDIGGLLARVDSYAQQGKAFGITVKSSALSLTLPYSTARTLVDDHGGAVLRPDITLGKYGGTVSIEMLLDSTLARSRTADGSNAYTVDVRLFLDSAGTLPYTVRDDSGRIVKSTTDASSLSFTATVGVAYTVSVEYSLTVTAPEGVTLVVMGQRVEAGQSLILAVTPEQTVTVGIESVTDGYRVTYVGYTVGESTTALSLGGGSFAMPNGDVSLTINGERIKYKIEFYNRGKLVRTFESYFGDTITVPTALSYSIDGNICYYFEGWAAVDGTLLGDRLTVSGDAVYNAVLREEAIELPPPTEPSQGLARLLVAYKVCIWMIRLVVLPALALGIVFIIHSRMKRRPKSKR